MPSQHPTRNPHQTAKHFRLDSQAPDSALLSPTSPHCSHQPLNNIRRGKKKKIPFKDPSPSQRSETRAAVPRQPSESREFISCSIDPTISTRTRVKVQIAVASQTHLGWLDPISFKDDWEEWEPHGMSMFAVYITTHASVPGTAERDVMDLQVELSTDTKIFLTRGGKKKKKAQDY